MQSPAAPALPRRWRATARSSYRPSHCGIQSAKGATEDVSAGSRAGLEGSMDNVRVTYIVRTAAAFTPTAMPAAPTTFTTFFAPKRTGWNIVVMQLCP